MTSASAIQVSLPPLSGLCLSSTGGYVGGIDSRGRPQVLDASSDVPTPIPLPIPRRWGRPVRVTQIQFAQPASTIVVGDADGRVWALSTLDSSCQMLGNFRAVNFQTLPHHNLLVWQKTPPRFTKKDSTSAETEVILYSLSRHLVISRRTVPFRINHVSVSPAGDLAILSEGNRGELIALQDHLRCLTRTHSHRSVFWCKNGRVLFCEGTLFKEYLVGHNTLTAILREREAIDLRAQTGRIYAHTFGEAIVVWLDYPNRPIHTIAPALPPTWLGFISSDFLAARIGQQIIIWDAHSGSAVYAIAGPCDPLPVARGGKIIVTINSEPTLLILRRPLDK